MAQTTLPRPPFHADQVGSLLRPKELHEARAAHKAGKLPAAELKKVEDRAIAQAVNKQEAVGLQAVTDGEFRRDFWHLDFLKQLDGIELVPVTGMTFNAQDVPPMVSVAGRIGCSRPIMVDHFAYLKSVAKRMPKFTMPSPGSAHFRGGRNAISRTVYPELEEFWADLGAAYRKAIRYLYDAGCRYLQLDDVGFSYLCDEKVRENFKKNGDDPGDLPRAYADAINAALKDRPADLGVTMHTCRGNFRSTWFAAGGYQDQVVEAMFSAHVDGFFMEWDSDRAGGFAPLRLLPKGKKVVLGLVTTKSGTLEGKDALKRRIDEAAKIVPLENLCLSPQCGFASTHHGNKLTEDEQWRKLERIVEVASEVWPRGS
ncbi:MAG TPA: 5-methyltetrahydropteroyltriglutamate--homocysteine S-methyltransferase [Burkholderiales bacterium]|nr:5-methyltetrahydropteroyltriglutamate--homocysteine S-methyltransferase [Burkholderiales bacterium]